jgi:hypothetical protein
MAKRNKRYTVEEIKSEGKLSVWPTNGWQIEFEIYDFENDVLILEVSSPLEGTLMEMIEEYAGEEELLEMEVMLLRALKAVQDRKNQDMERDAAALVCGPPAPPEGMTWVNGCWQDA